MPTPITLMRRRFLRRAFLALTLTPAALWLALLGSYVLDERPLTMPVAGVPSTRLVSTFGAPRDGGRRRHQGVDIFAPRGTRVLAAHDGIVVHTGHFRLGGLVVHTAGRRGVLAYYAHLDRLRDGLTVGELVAEGEVLGYVGNTGNARTTPPHLHFEARPIALGLPARDPVRLLGGVVRAERGRHARRVVRTTRRR